MTLHKLWVLIDRQNRFWRYAGGLPVTFRTRRQANERACLLDPKREWKPARAVLTVSEGKS